MATVTVTHRKTNTAAANPNVQVDSSAWNDTHSVTGLENVQNVDTTNAGNITSGTLPAARGPLTNARLAKTANYTVLNADKGSTFALGGSAFFTLTLGAASGYDANYSIIVLNEDSGRGKTIACNGLTSFILWPGQSIIIFNQNNVWQILGRSRWTLTGNLTLNVDPVSGVDTNDGLSTGAGGALLTISKAISIFQEQIDFQGMAGNIQLVDGTYSLGSGLLISGPLVGQLVFNINGNASTPGNVILTVTAGGSIATVQDYGAVLFQHLHIQSSGSGSNGFVAQKFGICDFNDVEFGSFAGGNHVIANPQGRINANGNYAITGDAANHIAAGGGVVATPGVTVTIGSARAFTNFVNIEFDSYYQAQNMTFSGAGVAGTTGKRYNADSGGVIQVNGGGANYFPGNSAGTVSSAGDYDGVIGLGTPSSGTLTNCTGLPTTGLTGSVMASQLSLGQLTAALGGDVTMTTVGTFYDGPSVAQGSTGTWYASGVVTVKSATTNDQVVAKLWDGTTLISAGYVQPQNSGTASIHVSGMITSPAGNLRISCANFTTGTTSKITNNNGGTSNGSVITAFRIN